MGGIVRQRVDLIARQDGTKRLRSIRGVLLVLLHGDRRFHLPDREHGDLAVVARADTDVGEPPRVEARELDVDGVAAGRQTSDGRDAGVDGLDRRGCGGAGDGLRSGNSHRGSDNNGARFIHHGHAQCPIDGRLRKRPRRPQTKRQQQAHPAEEPEYPIPRRARHFGILKLLRIDPRVDAGSGRTSSPRSSRPPWPA